MPLDGLVGAFPTTRDRFFLAYAESVSAVDWIVANNGRDALVKLIRSYADGVSDDEAFKARSGSTRRRSRQAWLAVARGAGAGPPRAAAGAGRAAAPGLVGSGAQPERPAGRLGSGPEPPRRRRRTRRSGSREPAGLSLGTVAIVVGHRARPRRGRDRARSSATVAPQAGDAAAGIGSSDAGGRRSPTTPDPPGSVPWTLPDETCADAPPAGRSVGAGPGRRRRPPAPAPAESPETRPTRPAPAVTQLARRAAGDPELAGHARVRAPRPRLPHRRPARGAGPARPVHDPGADAARRDRHGAPAPARRAQRPDHEAPLGQSPTLEAQGQGTTELVRDAEPAARGGADRGRPHPADRAPGSSSSSTTRRCRCRPAPTRPTTSSRPATSGRSSPSSGSPAPRRSRSTASGSRSRPASSTSADTILVNSAYLSPPYQVTAIGPHDLLDQLGLSQGWRDFIQTRRGTFGLDVSFAEPAEVDVPAFAGSLTLRASRASCPSPGPSSAPSGRGAMTRSAPGPAQPAAPSRSSRSCSACSSSSSSGPRRPAIGCAERCRPRT